MIVQGWWQQNWCQLVLHLDLIDLEATDFGQTEPRKGDWNLNWKSSCVEDDQKARAISERTRDIVHWWTSVLLTQELLAFWINVVLVSMPLKDMVRTPLIMSSPLMWTIKNPASTCEKWEWNSTKFLFAYGPCPNAQGVLMHFKINSRKKAIGKQTYGLWVKSTWLVILRSMTSM